MPANTRNRTAGTSLLHRGAALGKGEQLPGEVAGTEGGPLEAATRFQRARARYLAWKSDATERRAPPAREAAVGALEDEGVRIVNLDSNAGKASGARGDIGVTATVRTQADSSVRVEFSTSGNTAADPALIDRITQRYNMRMGR